jgi:hypothetical protein
MATAGEVLIPGDEEVLAFKAVDLLGFHGLRNRIVQRALALNKGIKPREES